MSEIINLKQARKKRGRDAKDKDSAVRRVQFGQSKSDKKIVDLSLTRLSKKLDDHKRTPSNPLDD